MPSSPTLPAASFTTRLAAFAADLTGKFATSLHFNPEDQLKAPMLTLLKGTAAALGLTVEVLTEVQDRERSGRPDIGVIAQALLAGYVELKAPGKGADPVKFKAQDRAQWEKFRDLPNLIYTDGKVQNPDSGLAALAVDWRHYLFPDADDAQFADAYAQTLTYALLLARWSGAVELSTTQATKTLRPQHGLLAEALKILADEQARTEIETPAKVLERVIGAVDPAALARQWAGGDPWLYFNAQGSRRLYQFPVGFMTLAALLEKALASELFTAAELPQPDEAQRRAIVEKAAKAELWEE